MNSDPIQDRAQELVWRRKLTDAEQAELLAYLATHPDARADCEMESALSTALDRLPDAAVSSNFAARVLQAIERDGANAGRVRERGWAWYWRVLVPRVAVAAVVIGFTGVVYQRYEFGRRVELARSVALVAASQPLPDMEALKNFDAIQRMSEAKPHADNELLTLFQ